jgi:hypothetical protein
MAGVVFLPVVPGIVSRSGRNGISFVIAGKRPKDIHHYAGRTWAIKYCAIMMDDVRSPENLPIRTPSSLFVLVPFSRFLPNKSEAPLWLACVCEESERKNCLHIIAACL